MMFCIRPYRSQDISQVIAVNRRCFSSPWSAWAIQYDVEQNPYSRWIVLEERAQPEHNKGFEPLLRWFKSPPKGHIIGFCAFWIMEGEAHITSLGVDPNYRGMGWGEVLLVSMLRRAIEMGARFSSLEVRVSNHRAINLYRKYAYHIVGQKPAYYHDNNEDAHLMATHVFDSTYYRMIEHRLVKLGSRVQWKDISFAESKL